MSVVSNELIWTPSSKLHDWLEVINDALDLHQKLYAVSDTETTGTSLMEENSKGELIRNRVVELAFCFYYYDHKAKKMKPLLDDDGDHIVFHEPVNFFAESKSTKEKFSSIERIPMDSTRVHGITEKYLFAEEVSPMGRPKLKKVALTFSELAPMLLRMFQVDNAFDKGLPIYMVFHNSGFDMRFLNSEMRVAGLPMLESYALTIDTLTEAKALMPGMPSYTLDALYEFCLETTGEERIERPFHDARTDSEILAVLMGYLLSISGE
jgi:DNA polymerase III epsilon subunit-like protein